MICAVQGCEREAKKRGWCDSHYARWRRTGDPGPPVLLRWPVEARAQLAAKQKANWANPDSGYHRSVVTHGATRSPTWNSWRHMIGRCSNPNGSMYYLYGGRGITVCQRWNPQAGGSFVNFYADMGARPEGMTLDRIDSDGNYEPLNCRWATPKQQVRNRRKPLLAVGGYCSHGHFIESEEYLYQRPGGWHECRLCTGRRVPTAEGAGAR